MGAIINLGKTDYSWDIENSCGKYKNRYNGLLLTDTGWRNFQITKHRRDTTSYFRINICNVCGGKCCQAFGNQFEQICIKCSEEWLKNSIKEMDKIKNKLKEQKKLIEENKVEMMKFENKRLSDWERMDILDKLESENEC